MQAGAPGSGAVLQLPQRHVPHAAIAGSAEANGGPHASTSGRRSNSSPRLGSGADGDVHVPHQQQLLHQQQQPQQQQHHHPQQRPSGAGPGAPQSAGALAAPAPADGFEPPARVIRPHTSRPPVSRGCLHHAAKALGIHLQGDVATNEISTAKYTLLTFLPVNLFEQFMRVANLYFLLCAILQLIPGLSPTSWFTTVAPLVFVLAVNAVKEGYDDACRHRNDTQINNRRVIMLDGEAGEVLVYWKDVVAGDLIKARGLFLG
ncbi:ATPase, class I, type 8B, member 2 [Monoraphidium neglectum]|uniref:ATPase, class I, type 8B, member 2 n=1 Tax=Monoraphidium neglectum TaxID=145388 RepID=A0A0D2M1N7_9CHLO|nr:ATPase, class I, type 8B, member 2 [Monoraphidium neglectum]KIY95371.1 ATPase, class I, type 8B, member 2 [Monoraphidium neglectum]|eukprot:XP_013894391.1 ATPase, class I, type 8B, member 2 [Monoraphidium neglectum]